MGLFTTPLQTLRRGGSLSRRAWLRLLNEATPETVDELLDLLETRPPLAHRRRVFEVLSRLATKPELAAAVARPESLRRLEGIVGYECDTAEDDVPALVAEYFGPDDDKAELFGQVALLAERLGAAALPLARVLLDGPRLPVEEELPDGAKELRGAQGTAIDLVAQHGEEADAERLARIFRDDEQNRWVRLEAGLAWYHLAGDDVLGELVEGLTHPKVCQPGDFPSCLGRLAEIGTPLVVHVMPLLGDVHSGRCHCAVWLLERIGARDALVDGLRRLLADAADVEQRAFAESTLRRIATAASD